MLSPRNLRKVFNDFLRAKTPGRALGHLVYCYPVLECNGRVIFTFFDDYLRRKGKQVDWVGHDHMTAHSQAEEYVEALLDWLEE